jgi:hypothetical protein
LADAFNQGEVVEKRRGFFVEIEQARREGVEAR